MELGAFSISLAVDGTATRSSWVDALKAKGYRLEQLSEPAHPESHEPLSLLLIAGAALLS